MKNVLSEVAEFVAAFDAASDDDARWRLVQKYRPTAQAVLEAIASATFEGRKVRCPHCFKPLKIQGLSVKHVDACSGWRVDTSLLRHSGMIDGQSTS